ncbi:TetR/AcrR family transcriptional regulator [Streptosporangium carneum]|uniref:TetR family transcriptional regulator n=1 Tax=Streptosporangium carneum TaxID=47481 RepID=A0A9W6I0Y1_9ACTN|nr:TetR/AcrR family transcriptional regulator [Streptosporangium carneum]GLK10005.1 TetR family transcriptional regulator [Streptosporangium carneum]
MQSSGAKRELPLIGGPPRERADAAENRRKILSAARRIAATGGVESLSMDEVAQTAGVGVGTVYRRFGDRAGLAYALIDERERVLQAAFLHGPPPLGPGAEPIERIGAFLSALVDRTEEQADLLLFAETSSPEARYAGGAYAAYHLHLATLILRLRPDADAHYLADALLAPLAANLYLHQRRTLGMDVERVKAGLDALIRNLGRTDPAT